jgi:8-amino-7-oxononanoate synthase
MPDCQISSLITASLFRTLKNVESINGVKAVIGGRTLTLFCTNDYLGLSGHPKVREAAKAAIDDIGFGAGSAPLIAGHTVYHERLESELARFKGAEKALLFGSGYLANTGMIPALASDGDAILSDELNHASIIDGCRLSKAEVFIYNHCDPASIEEKLKDCKSCNRRIIVTEGVFSMDGDIAPLPEVNGLAEKYDAALIVDEAHATGTIGAAGRGSFEHFGIAPGNSIQMGTLGKALGSYGAFVAANSDTIDWLVNKARSFIFSTALPPAACAAASAALQLIKEEKEKCGLLREKARTLRSSLKADGFNVLGDGTPIIPMVIGKADEALKLSAALMEAGYYVPAIRPPTVPEGKSRLRLTVSALHTLEDIEGLLDALRRLG